MKKRTTTKDKWCEICSQVEICKIIDAKKVEKCIDHAILKGNLHKFFVVK